MAGAQDEPAYVLHRRPWRETSLLLDLFTLNQGRIRLIAKGATRPRNPWKGQLQPFQPLLIAWQGRTDLKTLTQVDTQPAKPLTQPKALYSGFYLNELLQRLWPEAEPAQHLFAAYIEALDGLARAEVETSLRRFERTFMNELGYGFNWHHTSDTAQPINPAQTYGYDPQQGLLENPTDQAPLRQLPGQALLAAAREDWQDPAANQVAKAVARALWDYLLQGRPLNSRALFSRKPSP